MKRNTPPKRIEMKSKEKQVVLIVEDNKEYQSLLALGHEKSRISCDCVFADSAENALTYLSEETPNLILSDYELPGLNGLQLLDLLKKNDAWKDIPVLMFSMFGTDKLMDRAYARGAQGFMDKPEDYTSAIELWQDLRTFLRSNKALSDWE
ncbi:two-component system response regulator [Siphonobacter sp. BAB-5385]|uniref:response regulator n=1 Tax=Siphonobacter sp. BAB-5385 TaxID=1864822 RepID=UPI001140312B|nr:response regulator [Siphonobacter sp. BAB-5385]